MNSNERTAYKLLAMRLDSLPNGFPPTHDGAELRLLAKLYTPEEAALAAQLSQEMETPDQIEERLRREDNVERTVQELRGQLKDMARKGLIAVGRTENGLGYALMPFVVGVYEAQAGRIDQELAQLFEAYYQQSFGPSLSERPSYHRVIPIGESVRLDMEIHPYESASEIVNQANAWGVLDCICRVQKKLIGDPCEHPIDVCMALSQRPNAFDQNPVIRALTHEQAKETLHRAAKAGLVHTVTNSQEGVHYICNCCTCSCGILRGIAEFGIANAVARSAFVNQVDEALCIGCEYCLEFCQFNALVLIDHIVQVVDSKCTGCGVCVLTCPEGALALIRRPDTEILPIPSDQADWGAQRLESRRSQPASAR